MCVGATAVDLEANGLLTALRLLAKGSVLGEGFCWWVLPGTRSVVHKVLGKRSLWGQGLGRREALRAPSLI